MVSKHTTHENGDFGDASYNISLTCVVSLFHPIAHEGNWQLVYGPENVSPWLERFMICGTTVSCEERRAALRVALHKKRCLMGLFQWIGLRENWNRKALYVTRKSMPVDFTFNQSIDY